MGTSGEARGVLDLRGVGAFGDASGTEAWAGEAAGMGEATEVGALGEAAG